MSIKFTHSISKIKLLAETISLSIMEGKLKPGDNLASINEASSHYKVSRDTVFKAYNELKQSGVIDSAPQKGYFVKQEINRVLLLLDNYSSFKQNLFHSFAGNLPENYKVDLIFHQYNEHLFETIIRESIGKYSMYVVMNFSNDKFSDSLKAIPASKLLLLDFGNFDKTGFSYICQDFGMALYDSLLQGLSQLKKYRKITFIFPEDLRHPVTAIDYFSKFCLKNGFEYELIRKNSEWKEVEKSCVYLCILTEDMVKVIKDADKNGYEIGSDIGLIVYNDDPVLEVIKNGISSISIDFAMMGEKAAQFVKSKQEIQEFLNTKLIIRGSV